MLIKPPKKIRGRQFDGREFYLWGLVILDCIWRIRNKIVHGGQFHQIKKMLTICASRVEEFRRSYPNKLEVIVQYQQLLPPLPDFMKINVDG